MKLKDLLADRPEKHRKPDFSHMPLEVVSEFIELKMKDKLTANEQERLQEIEADIRYIPNTDSPEEPLRPRYERESYKDYIEEYLSKQWE